MRVISAQINSFGPQRIRDGERATSKIHRCELPSELSALNNTDGSDGAHIINQLLQSQGLCTNEHNSIASLSSFSLIFSDKADAANGVNALRIKRHCNVVSMRIYMSGCLNPSARKISRVGQLTYRFACPSKERLSSHPTAVQVFPPKSRFSRIKSRCLTRSYKIFVTIAVYCRHFI